MDSHERTFIMIKPDGVQRGLVGKIIERFESRGLKLVALKFKVATQELLAEHYKEHVLKPFYKGLADYMASGPVVCMVWEGSRAVAVGRAMLGATKPIDSAPGTIRGDFCLEVGRNLCHGSDSVDSAKREIGLWFEEKEIISWKAANHQWVFEQ